MDSSKTTTTKHSLTRQIYRESDFQIMLNFNSTSKDVASRQLSNFYQPKKAIVIKSRSYPTSEHCFHGEKFQFCAAQASSNERKTNILAHANKFLSKGSLGKDPVKAKAAGGKSKAGFALESTELKGWDRAATDIQTLICKYRLSTEPALRDLLLSSGDKLILHQDNRAKATTPWGGRLNPEGKQKLERAEALTDADVIGKNKLGRLWMELRNEVKTNSSKKRKQQDVSSTSQQKNKKTKLDKSSSSEDSAEASSSNDCGSDDSAFSGSDDDLVSEEFDLADEEALVRLREIGLQDIRENGLPGVELEGLDDEEVVALLAAHAQTLGETGGHWLDSHAMMDSEGEGGSSDEEEQLRQRRAMYESASGRSAALSSNSDDSDSDATAADRWNNPKYTQNKSSSDDDDDESSEGSDDDEDEEEGSTKKTVKAVELKKEPKPKKEKVVHESLAAKFDASVSVCVRNLSFDVKEEALTEFFTKQGLVIAYTIYRYRSERRESVIL